jgi:phosphatidate cytidylyltransferase
VNGVASRLLIFLVGLPAIIVSTLFVFWYNHVIISALVVACSGLGAMEFAVFFRNKGIDVKGPESFAVGALIPLTEYLSLLGVLPQGTVLGTFAALLLLTLTREIFARTEARIASILERVTARLTVIVYPGVLMLYIVRIASLPKATVLLFVYFLMTFGNDSMAWACGVMFGKRRNLIPVSPNKSVAGFVGGFAISTIVGIVAALLRPDAFPGPLWAAALFGACVGAATILGDLAESALKRSARMKDSGQVIPGRGGMLDSVDSLVFAAPVFYYLFLMVFQA